MPARRRRGSWRRYPEYLARALAEEVFGLPHDVGGGGRRAHPVMPGPQDEMFRLWAQRDRGEVRDHLSIGCSHRPQGDRAFAAR